MYIYKYACNNSKKRDHEFEDGYGLDYGRIWREEMEGRKVFML